MKKQTTKLNVVSQLLMLLSVIGFCSAAQAQVAVGLQVNASQTALEVTTRGSCQKAPNPNGCIHVSSATQINYSLPNVTCSGRESWRLGQVTLSTSNKGQPGNIGQVAASDFNANESTGVVTPVSSSANHILIRDNNSQKYDIWYTVSASCGGATIYTDPRIENEGTN